MSIIRHGLTSGDPHWKNGDIVNLTAIDFSNTKLSLSRSITSYAKVRALIGHVVRGRTIFMKLKTSGLVLDVGCGPNNAGQKINLDYSWHPGIDVCCDITRGLPFLPDNYAGGIFTEHCLEHIPFGAMRVVLREFYRVLQPGGSLRIVVPDLGIYIEKYVNKRPMPYEEGDRGAGVYSPAVSINRIMHSHGHQFIYDFETMKLLLEQSNFVQIQKLKCGEGRVAYLDTSSRQVESLYIEAVK